MIGFGIGVPGGNEYDHIFDFWQNKSTLGTPYTGQTIMYEFNFVVSLLSSSPLLSFFSYELVNIINLFIFSPFYSFDTVLAYAYALDGVSAFLSSSLIPSLSLILIIIQLMNEGQSFANATKGSVLYNRLANQNFTGTTGNVIIQKGDRLGYSFA